ncbi:MAG: glycoside hydrolase family 43 protein, partial [Thermoguttaceae bacterium]
QSIMIKKLILSASFGFLLMTSFLTLSEAQAAEDVESSHNKPCYVMSYFINNGEDGLHLSWSEDGYKWEPLNNGKSFLAPTVGEHKLMRDPSIVQAPDGTFHMVWTISWTQPGIGYASSKDLINWSPQKMIPVMENDPKTRNCWAPEIFYDEPSKTYYIFWASTVVDKFPGIGSEDNYNHRQYYVSTKDFETFSPTKLFFDPGHNVIDSFLAKEGDKYLLFYKDETLKPEPKKSIHLATGDSPTGPFTPQMEIGHTNWIEGPSAIKIGDWWYVYYDCYSKGHYGAVRSKDLKTWENITDKISFPSDTRHGTIFKVKPEVLKKLQEKK